MSRGAPSLRKQEQGQSLVELALGMVVLLILLAGIVDLGRALYYNAGLRDAAQEGQVFGALNPPNYDLSISPATACANIEARARAVLPDANDPGVTVNVFYGSGSGTTCNSAALSQSCAGQPLRVEVRDDFALTMPFLGALIGGDTLRLQVVSSGVVLRPACP